MPRHRLQEAVKSDVDFLAVDLFLRSQQARARPPQGRASTDEELRRRRLLQRLRSVLPHQEGRRQTATGDPVALDLSDCVLKPDDFSAVTYVASTQPAVTALDVSAQPLTNRSVELVVGSLSKNKNIVQLVVAPDAAPPSSLARLSGAVELNRRRQTAAHDAAVRQEIARRYDENTVTLMRHAEALFWGEIASRDAVLAAEQDQRDTVVKAATAHHKRAQRRQRFRHVAEVVADRALATVDRETAFRSSLVDEYCLATLQLCVVAETSERHAIGLTAGEEAVGRAAIKALHNPSWVEAKEREKVRRERDRAARFALAQDETRERNVLLREFATALVPIAEEESGARETAQDRETLRIARERREAQHFRKIEDTKREAAEREATLRNAAALRFEQDRKRQRDVIEQHANIAMRHMRTDRLTVMRFFEDVAQRIERPALLAWQRLHGAVLGLQHVLLVRPAVTVRLSRHAEPVYFLGDHDAALPFDGAVMDTHLADDWSDTYAAAVKVLMQAESAAVKEHQKACAAQAAFENQYAATMAHVSEDERDSIDELAACLQDGYQTVLERTCPPRVGPLPPPTELHHLLTSVTRCRAQLAVKALKGDSRQHHFTTATELACVDSVRQCDVVDTGRLCYPGLNCDGDHKKATARSDIPGWDSPATTLIHSGSEPSLPEDSLFEGTQLPCLDGCPGYPASQQEASDLSRHGASELFLDFEGDDFPPSLSPLSNAPAVPLSRRQSSVHQSSDVSSRFHGVGYRYTSLAEVGNCTPPRSFGPDVVTPAVEMVLTVTVPTVSISLPQWSDEAVSLPDTPWPVLEETVEGDPRWRLRLSIGTADVSLRTFSRVSVRLPHLWLSPLHRSPALELGADPRSYSLFPLAAVSMALPAPESARRSASLSRLQATATPLDGWTVALSISDAAVALGFDCTPPVGLRGNNVVIGETVVAEITAGGLTPLSAEAEDSGAAEPARVHTSVRLRFTEFIASNAKHGYDAGVAARHRAMGDAPPPSASDLAGTIMRVLSRLRTWARRPEESPLPEMPATGEEPFRSSVPAVPPRAADVVAVVSDPQGRSSSMSLRLALFRREPPPRVVLHRQSVFLRCLPACVPAALLPRASTAELRSRSIHVQPFHDAQLHDVGVAVGGALEVELNGACEDECLLLPSSSALRSVGTEDAGVVWNGDEELCSYTRSSSKHALSFRFEGTAGALRVVQDVAHNLIRSVEWRVPCDALGDRTLQLRAQVGNRDGAADPQLWSPPAVVSVECHAKPSLLEPSAALVEQGCVEAVCGVATKVAASSVELQPEADVLEFEPGSFLSVFVAQSVSGSRDVLSFRKTEDVTLGKRCDAVPHDRLQESLHHLTAFHHFDLALWSDLQDSHKPFVAKEFLVSGNPIGVVLTQPAHIFFLFDRAVSLKRKEVISLLRSVAFTGDVPGPRELQIVLTDICVSRGAVAVFVDVQPSEQGLRVFTRQQGQSMSAVNLLHAPTMQLRRATSWSLSHLGGLQIVPFMDSLFATPSTAAALGAPGQRRRGSVATDVDASARAIDNAAFEETRMSFTVEGPGFSPESLRPCVAPSLPLGLRLLSPAQQGALAEVAATWAKMEVWSQPVPKPPTPTFAEFQRRRVLFLPQSAAHLARQRLARETAYGLVGDDVADGPLPLCVFDAFLLDTESQSVKFAGQLRTFTSATHLCEVGAAPLSQFSVPEVDPTAIGARLAENEAVAGAWEPTTALDFTVSPTAGLAVGDARFIASCIVMGPTVGEEYTRVERKGGLKSPTVVVRIGSAASVWGTRTRIPLSVDNDLPFALAARKGPPKPLARVKPTLHTRVHRAPTRIAFPATLSSPTKCATGVCLYFPGLLCGGSKPDDDALLTGSLRVAFDVLLARDVPQCLRRWDTDDWFSTSAADRAWPTAAIDARPLDTGAVFTVPNPLSARLRKQRRPDGDAEGHLWLSLAELDSTVYSVKDNLILFGAQPIAAVHPAPPPKGRRMTIGDSPRPVALELRFGSSQKVKQRYVAELIAAVTLSLEPPKAPKTDGTASSVLSASEFAHELCLRMIVQDGGGDPVVCYWSFHDM